MTTIREAAQQALEAYSGGPHWRAFADAMEALRAALAEPVQEPVAWLFTNLQSGECDFCFCADEHDHDREMWHRQPLYNAPPQRKPLTDEEIEEINRDLPLLHMQASKGSVAVVFARAIERAHGIGD